MTFHWKSVRIIVGVMNMEEEKYKELAERNGWSYSGGDGRPYFMRKSGGYAMPDDSTTYADKELLASIISEGSDEMKKLVLKCWENKIEIGGPCSGIKAFHSDDRMMWRTHFAFIGPQEIMYALYVQYKNDFNVHYSEKRLDVDKNFDRAITKEESDAIFRKMNELFDKVFSNNLGENSPKHL